MSKSGSDLFIVDNSDSDWKVHRYLKEWYDRHWKEAEDVTPDILRVMEHHTKDVIVIDEAHHFRNPCIAGTGDNQAYFTEGGRNLGIHNLQSHFNQLERKFQ